MPAAYPARMPRNPVADRVVHGIAGSAAHPEQLRLRPRPVADAGDVLVPVPVDLRCPHHHVPASRRDHREHLAVGQPALDVPLLIDHFVARNNARFGTHISGVDSEGRRLLMEYPWPGNVRELENTIERAMVLAEKDSIGADDLPERVREAKDPIQLHLTSGELSIKKTARVIEEILIRRALQKTKGNRTRAAEVLEISHRALLYKIKDYHIDL